MNEDLVERIERIGFKPERAEHQAQLDARYRKKAGRGGKKARPNVKQKRLDPVMTEILRPFPQGRRQLAMIGDLDLLPFSAREYRLYLEGNHWLAFTKSYHEDQATAKECFVCGSSTYDLHHITYARLGHEQFEDVIALCRTHHAEVHRVVRAGKKLRDAHIYVRERCIERNA